MRRLALVAALALAGACSAPAREAERALRAYNQASIAAYRARDPSLLAAVATEQQQKKVAQLIEFKVTGNLVLESTLESLEVTAASLPEPGRLLASTRERWRYFDRPLAPGAPPGQLFVVVMDLDYELQRDGDAWKVAAVRARKSEYLEPKGYRLDAPGSASRTAEAQGHGPVAPSGSGSK